MPENKSLDLTGLGRAMEAIPKEAWIKVVDTATETFDSLVRPITAVTGGLGRWLEQKFENMVEVEKVLLADGLEKARQRMEAGARSRQTNQSNRTA